MEKHFTALLKYAVTKVGDEIETINGIKVEITKIKEIEVVDYHHVLIKFTGKPITT